MCATNDPRNASINPLINAAALDLNVSFAAANPSAIVTNIFGTFHADSYKISIAFANANKPTPVPATKIPKPAAAIPNPFSRSSIAPIPLSANPIPTIMLANPAKAAPAFKRSSQLTNEKALTIITNEDITPTKASIGSKLFLVSRVPIT